MSKKSTKSALLASGISLLLCFTMLLGTTFAWFTDSVSTTNNIITAGNLDVELYHKQAKETGWSKVGTSTNVFKENTLWEPGHAEVVNLKIANEGTLDLMYQLGVNIASETGSTNVAGEAFKLSDYIKYAVIDGETTYANSAAAAAAAEAANPTKLNVAYNSGNIKLNDHEEKKVTVIVYMPTTVGNEANYRGAAVPTINLGINLYATQLNSEEDSFGPDYDASSTLPAVGSAKIEEDSGATTIEAGNVSIIVPEEAEPGEYQVVVTNKNANTNQEGQTTYTADINLLKDGVKVERNGAVTYLVEIEIGTDKSILKVLHNDREIVAFDYNAGTGILSFETDSFSPFTVIYEKAKIKVSSEAEFVSALDVAQSGDVIDATGVTIDINRIGTSVPGGKMAYSIPGNVTIKNLTIIGSYRGGNYIFLGGNPEEDIVFENCIFEPSGRVMGLGMQGVDGGVNSVVYNNCTFKGVIIIESTLNPTLVATYNNCTFTKATTGNNYVMTYGGTYNFNGCTFDYTGVTQNNNGTVNTGCVNVNSDSDGSSSTTAILNNCKLINCGTRKYGSNSTLTVK